MTDSFADDGPIAKGLPDYCRREPQVAMYDHVREAMATCGRLVIEASTGTGKGLAYIAAGLSHPDPVVISTANIALQSQLMTKDLPFMNRVMGPFRFGLAKGRSNYLCKRLHKDYFKQTTLKFKGYRVSPGQMSSEQKECAILEWGSHTETGDVEELSFVPGSIWEAFSSTSDNCHGDKCAYHTNCFARRAKDNLDGCKFVVCNHHLLLANMVAYNNVLPGFRHLIVDEGHKLADIARGFLGWDFSPKVFQDIIAFIAKKAHALAPDKAKDREYVSKLPEAMVDMRERAMAGFRDLSGIFGGKTSVVIKRGHRKHFAGIHGVATELSAILMEIINLASSGELVTTVAKYIERATTLVTRIVSIWDQNDNAVHFASINRYGTVTVSKRQLNVADTLAEDLWANRASVVTSATLCAGGDFSYICHELGLLGAKTVALSTPFDLANQAMLFVSKRAPDPKAMHKDEYQRAIGKLTKKIIESAHGRTLALFTSYEDMVAAAGFMTGEVPYRILVQGDDNRQSLLRQFQEDEGSVLFGVDSFWAGVDIPGPSLSCVVIAKVPFKRPDDPVWSALCQRCDDMGGSSFWDMVLPDAIIQLRQGMGRLIRRFDDRGVVVIMDGRIMTSKWGKKVLNAIAGMRVSSDLNLIGGFLGDSTMVPQGALLGGEDV